jgi:hypothetical protein
MKRETGYFQMENGRNTTRQDSNPHQIENTRRAGLMLSKRTTWFRNVVISGVVRVRIK